MLQTTHDETQLLRITPLLEGPVVGVLTALAGVGSGPRRIWAGQPGPRSPWLPCRGGCCLVLESPAPPGLLAADWLRFLLREVLAPEAAASVARAAAAGLRTAATPYRVSGEVLLDDAGTTRQLVARGRQVRLSTVVDDLLPLPAADESESPARLDAAPPAALGEVVDLGRHRHN